MVENIWWDLSPEDAREFVQWALDNWKTEYAGEPGAASIDKTHMVSIAGRLLADMEETLFTDGHDLDS
jgi:hypothetical protein